MGDADSDSGKEFIARALERLQRAGCDRLAEAVLNFAKGQPQHYPHELQQPTFYVPGLTARPWHVAADYPWVADLEASAAQIRCDLMAYREAEGSGFQAYHGDGSWKMLYLGQFGDHWEESRRFCPHTSAAIDRIPRHTGTICFSALSPGSHIEPHCGSHNAKIRCQLGLTGTDGCSIRVGSETRTWSEGRCLLFDDSFEHEVWHRGTATRIVLILDVWHPELSDQEVALLSEIIDASPVFNQDRASRK